MDKIKNINIYKIHRGQGGYFKSFKLLCILIIIFFFAYFCSYNNNNNQTPLLSKNNFIDSNENILEPYIKDQKDFCKNPNKYLNKEIEDTIMISEVHLNQIIYPLIVPKMKVGITAKIL